MTENQSVYSVISFWVKRKGRTLQDLYDVTGLSRGGFHTRYSRIEANTAEELYSQDRKRDIDKIANYLEIPVESFLTNKPLPAPGNDTPFVDPKVHELTIENERLKVQLALVGNPDILDNVQKPENEAVTYVGSDSTVYDMIRYWTKRRNMKLVNLIAEAELKKSTLHSKFSKIQANTIQQIYAKDKSRDIDRISKILQVPVSSFLTSQHINPDPNVLAESPVGGFGIKTGAQELTELKKEVAALRKVIEGLVVKIDEKVKA